MNAPFLRINTWDDVPRAISTMQASKDFKHRVPTMQALYQGRIGLYEVQRAGSAKAFKFWSAACRLPALAIVGDDDHATPDGPDTWPIARRMLRWARFVLIHGGAGEAWHYEYAVMLTEKFGRLVMIKSSSANIEAWHAAAERWSKGAEGQILRPPPGCPHPSLDRGQMQ